jgi:group I intron endonuclease
MYSTPAIYAIVNQVTKDMYIGSAVNLIRRWRVHKSNLNNGKHHCEHMQNAFRKYGEDAFCWEIVEFVDDATKLIEKEQFWIDFFKPTYNKRKIANSCLGVKRSEQARENMRKAQLGRKQSPETIAKRSAALKGKPRPPEVRAKISASHFGIRPSSEARAKMSESAKRRVR